MTDVQAPGPENQDRFFHLDTLAAMSIPDMCAFLRAMSASYSQEASFVIACQNGVDPRLGLIEAWRHIPATVRPPLRGGRLACLVRSVSHVPGALRGVLLLARAYDRLSGRQILRRNQQMLRVQEEGLDRLRAQFEAMHQALAVQLHTQGERLQAQSERISSLEQSLIRLDEAGECFRQALRTEISASRADARAFESDLLRRVEQMLFDAEQAIDALAIGLVTHEAGKAYVQTLETLPEALKASVMEGAERSDA